MTNKIYNTIKQVGKKVMPYAIAGAMAFGSANAYARDCNDSNLPIYQETSQDTFKMI